MNKLPDDDTGNALARIEQDGSDLSKPMDIDFFVAVDSPEHGHAIAKQAQALGFNCSVELDEPSGDWTCYCSINVVPDYTTIVKIEEQLDSLAKPYNGYIDGFGTFGNSDV